MNNDELKGKYLNIQEVASLLNVSDKLIYKMVSDGYLPGFKLGSRVLVDKNELDMRILELKEESTRKKHLARACSTRKIVD